MSLTRRKALYRTADRLCRRIAGSRAALISWPHQGAQTWQTDWKQKRREADPDEALFALESWDGLFLLFMADRERRRSEWMDPAFYEAERADLKAKLRPCESLISGIKEEMFALLEKAGVTAPAEETKAAWFEEDLYWYAAAVLFLSCRPAEDPRPVRKNRAKAKDTKKCKKNVN